MKPIHFTVTAPKPRRHQALFDQDLPFRARREQPKTVYQRRAKHPHREQE
jgi:stalled ribosome alternative rescue factor ArfA